MAKVLDLTIVAEEHAAVVRDPDGTFALLWADEGQSIEVHLDKEKLQHLGNEILNTLLIAGELRDHADELSDAAAS